MSLLPSVVALGAVALVALALSRRRASPVSLARERHAAARALALTTVLQAAHFAEEAATGFPAALGGALGLPGMPPPVFITFNLLWLAIWAASIAGVRSARPAAFFAAWFLGLAGALNGLAHPLLAVAAGRYFPGLATSPAVGAAGLWLCLRLLRATRPAPAASASGG